MMETLRTKQSMLHPSSLVNPGPNVRICTASEMRELDDGAESEYRIPASKLMENAGRGAVDTILAHDPSIGIDSEILIFAGKGNNAGDAFVVARHFLCLGRRVRVFHLLSREEYKPVVRENFEALQHLKCRMMRLTSIQELEQFLSSTSRKVVAVDGLIGGGLRGPLEGLIYDIVEVINLRIPEIIALDIPTGVCGDTGAVRSTSILATLTCSFGFPKLGHFLAPGAARRGKLVHIDIGLPPSFRKVGRRQLLGALPMSKHLQARDRYGHKNSFGHTLLFGGSPGRIGAIALSTKACHKVGTGLVTASTWKDSEALLSQKLWDETMFWSLAEDGQDLEVYARALSHYTSVVVGPGMGTRADAKRVIEVLCSVYKGPLVLDADALNVISEHKLHDLIARRGGATVLTPHPGEMARLLDRGKEAVMENPIGALEEACERTQSIVLLKGPATLIHAPGEKVFVNHYPNDGMATGGSGDVLAGMIGGLLGQRLEPMPSAQLAVFLHSVSGAIAARSLGHRAMSASDIIGNIGNAFQELKAISQEAVTDRRILPLY